MPRAAPDDRRVEPTRRIFPFDRTRQVSRPVGAPVAAARRRPLDPVADALPAPPPHADRASLRDERQRRRELLREHVGAPPAPVEIHVGLARISPDALGEAVPPVA